MINRKTKRCTKIVFLYTMMVLFSFSCKNYTFENPVDTNTELQEPSSLTVSFSADTLAILKWNHSELSQYSFVAEVSENDTTWTELGTVNQIDSLRIKYNFFTSKIYHFRVGACRDENISQYIFTQAQIEELVAPSDLSVSFLSDTLVNISWLDNSSYETGFDIEVSPDNDNFILIKQQNANLTSTNIAGVFLISEEYTFRVRAKTAINYSEYSNSVSISPELEAPSNLEVTFIDSERTLLSWQDNSTIESGYEIEMSEDGLNFNLVKNEAANTTSSEVTNNYRKGVPYYFRVRAKTTINFSDYSDIESAGLKPDIPLVNYPLDNSVDQPVELTLSWSTAEGADNYLLQVSDNSSFTGFFINETVGNVTSKTLSNLRYSTNYYWRIYALNDFGVSEWSTQWTFQTAFDPQACPGVPTFTYMGKIYSSVKIGDQCWLKENLNVGTMIQLNQQAVNNQTIEKYCINNIEDNCNHYGGLYQWNEAMQYLAVEGAQGICPDGWHIPTQEEYFTLSASVSNNGNALKSEGSSSAINSSGFSALMTGSRQNSDGSIIGLGSSTSFWSSYSTNENPTVMQLVYSSSDINYFGSNKSDGRNIRCIQGEGSMVPIPNIPTLSSPSISATDQPTTLTLSWNNSANAESYELQVSENSSFSSFVYNQSALINTNQEISGLSNSTTYYWRVRAYNNSGDSGWSDTWNFTTTGAAPAKPVLISPANGSADHVHLPTFSWNASNGADSYTLQVSPYNSFSYFVYNMNRLTGTSKEIVGGFSYQTQYYWRVRATNNYGTSAWSEVWSFVIAGAAVSGEPCPGIPTVTYEGKIYNTVQIGEQCWLKENLSIGMMRSLTTDHLDNSVIEKYCYDNNETNCELFGGYYQWNEAMQYIESENAQGICPEGWHIPGLDEFQTLTESVNYNANSLINIGEGSGTNTSGFSALFLGLRYDAGWIGGYGADSYFWTSTNHPSIDNASIFFHFSNISNFVSSLPGNAWTRGLNIRCIRGHGITE